MTGHPLDLALRAASPRPLFHHALADGGHLGPMPRVDYRSDEVAAEGGPDLEKEVLVDDVVLLGLEIADLEVGAVGGEARAKRAGYAGAEVTTHGEAPKRRMYGQLSVTRPAERPSRRAGSGRPRARDARRGGPGRRPCAIRPVQAPPRPGRRALPRARASSVSASSLPLAHQLEAHFGDPALVLLDENPDVLGFAHFSPTLRCIPGRVPGPGP